MQDHLLIKSEYCTKATAYQRNYAMLVSSGKFRGRPPPTAQNFLNLMQFFTKFGKIICWRLPLKGWRPLLRGILDQPLLCDDV